MLILFKLLLSLLCAGLLAFICLRVRLNRPPHMARNGPWRMNLKIAGPKEGPHSRAFNARRNPFALQSSEVIYCSAITDSAGALLDSRYTYAIEGADPDTRWWSLIAYAGGQPIDNSYSQTTVTRRPDGAWVIHLAPGDQHQRLTLVLRCYGPSQALLARIRTAPLPTITKLS